MIQIIRTITGDEAPTAVTLLTLTRADTGVAVPSSAWSDTGGVFSVSGTSWSISFTAPAAGLTYSYTYRRTWSDGSHSDGAGTITDYATSYSGSRYTTETSLRLFLGNVNATAFLDGDGDGLSDSGAAQQAIDAAESEVDSVLSGGPYAVPLTFAGAVNPILQMHVNGLAAWWLNAKRPMTQQQQPGVSFNQVRTNALAWLRDVWYGDNKIAGATASTAASNEPIALRPGVNADGQAIQNPPYPSAYYDAPYIRWG